MDCFDEFGELFGTKILRRKDEYLLSNDIENSIHCQQLYDIIKNIDIVDLIKNRHTMESCIKIHRYGMAVLQVLDEIDYKNINKESELCQKEKVAEQ